MEAFSTYEFYNGEYHGKLSEGDYKSAVPHARAEIMSQTNGKAANAGTAMQDNLKMCECALCDLFNSASGLPAGAGAVTSVTFDDYSVGYAAAGNGGNALARQIKAICSRWLQTPENLMCRWI